MKYRDPVNCILSEVIRSLQQAALRWRVPEDAPAVRQIDTLRNRLREVMISTELFFPACLLQQGLRPISVLPLLFLPVAGVQLQPAPKADVCVSWSSAPRRCSAGLGASQKRALLEPGADHVSKDVHCKFALFLKGNQKGHCISTEVILKLSLTQGFFLLKDFCLLSVAKIFEKM